MLAFAIFVVTLVLVIWQPRGLGIGWSALGGAAVALATGVVDWGDVGTVWHIVWDATFTFVALIIISLILDEAGFFAWAALHIARWGNGRGRLLFPLIVILGAMIAAVFANDGARPAADADRRRHPDASRLPPRGRPGLHHRHRASSPTRPACRWSSPTW